MKKLEIDVDITLFLITVFWTIWLILTSFKSKCFNLLESYFTIFLLYLQIINLFLTKKKIK